MEFAPVNPDGPQLGTESSDKHAPSLTQHGSTPPAPIPTFHKPADQPASVHIDATSPAPSDTAPEESRERDNSTTDGTSSTPPNQIPGATRNSQVPPAKSVSAKQLEANRKNSKRSTGPTSAAGKQRSSQNSYKEGLYARRLYPTLQQWAEDGGDYRMIAIAVHEHYQPKGLWEAFWAEQIVTSAIRHARGMGFQQRTLASDYRFAGTSLSTSERHVSSAFKQMLQAIKMLESIEENRRAASAQFQAIASDRGHGPDASESPVSVPSESSETMGGSTNETDQPADSGDSEETVDAGRSNDGQDGDAFLYDGPPPDPAVVSPSQSGQGGAGSAAQPTGISGTKPLTSSQSDPKAALPPEKELEPPHLLADVVYEMMGWPKDYGTNPPSTQPQPKSQPSPGIGIQAQTVPQRSQADVKNRSNDPDSKSEPVPSVARVENVGTNPTAPGNESAQADFKRDSK
jgi:hypothetical protein